MRSKLPYNIGRMTQDESAAIYTEVLTKVNSKYKKKIGDLKRKQQELEVELQRKVKELDEGFGRKSRLHKFIVTVHDGLNMTHIIEADVLDKEQAKDFALGCLESSCPDNYKITVEEAEKKK